MRRALTLVSFVLALSGCLETEASEVEIGQPHSLSSGEIQSVKAGVRRNLKDPASAQFGSMKASINRESVVTVCGLVNAKNSFGGFTGSLPYLGVLTRGGFVVVDIASPTQSEINATLNTCRKSGIVL